MKCQKIPYTTKKVAKIYAKRKGFLHNNKLEVYKCMGCGYWHLTSKKSVESKVFFRTKMKKGTIK